MQELFYPRDILFLFFIWENVQKSYICPPKNTKGDTRNRKHVKKHNYFPILREATFKT